MLLVTRLSWGIDLSFVPLLEYKDSVAKLMSEKCKREVCLLQEGWNMFESVGHHSVSIQKLTSRRYLFSKLWILLFTYPLVNQTGERKLSFIDKNSMVLDKILLTNKRWSHYFEGFISFSVQAWLPAIICMYVWLSRRTNQSKEITKSANKIKKLQSLVNSELSSWIAWRKNLITCRKANSKTKSCMFCL